MKKKIDENTLKDYIGRVEKGAYQCKSVIDPATGRFDVGKTVESIEAALARRDET